jgi:hypothetical protein
MTKLQQASIETIARTGLIAKGIVYLLLGGLAFMAAFHVNGQSPTQTDQGGVFSFVNRQIRRANNTCFNYNRFVVLYFMANDTGIQRHRTKRFADSKGIMGRARYFFSGIDLCFICIRSARRFFSPEIKITAIVNRTLRKELLDKPFGQWLVGIAAVIIIIVGVYQIFYGLSEKYKKHVTERSKMMERKHY